MEAFGFQRVRNLFHARRNLHLDRLLGGIAQSEGRAEAIPLPHHRSDARENHQVLRRTDGRGARPEQSGCGTGDGDNAEARDGVVQRNFHGARPLIAQEDTSLPQKECIEELSRDLPAPSASVRQRLQPKVPLSDDMHLGRRRLYAVAALPHHRRQDLPALVRHQLEQPFIDSRKRDLSSARRRRPIRSSD